jgi:endoglucanase
VLLFAAAAAAVSLGAPAVPPAAAAGPPLSISVAGNRLVDGTGATVRLLGVNRSSTEYACFYGYAYADGAGEAQNPLGEADASAIAAWHATAVRIPLNEDCWLGINGYPPASSGGHPSGLTAAGYRDAIAGYVAALHARGLYAILDLHWSAPGATPADGQRSLPDDHSVAFWSSVAERFLGDPGVVFDAFNEPFGTAVFPVSWGCWRDGGCQVPLANDQTAPSAEMTTYAAVGMQAIVDAIRTTGATQPIMLGGLAYANDLGSWLANEPHDPLGQLIASFHNYTGEACASEACWQESIAPVAAQVPLVAGEFGEDDCPPSAGGPAGTNPANFDNRWMSWADAHGIGYTAWGWFVLPSPTCSSLALITDYSGTPLDPNGVALRSHLAALAGGAGGPGAPGVGGGAPTGAAPSSRATPPVIWGATQSHALWREGNAPAALARVRAVPVGTTFAFHLDEPAALRLVFMRRVTGRTVRGRCLAPSPRSRRGRACIRMSAAGALVFAARGGAERVRFQGRLSPSLRLAPGGYTLIITAADAAARRSRPLMLGFRIVRR